MSSTTGKQHEMEAGQDIKADVLHDDDVNKDADIVQGDYSGAAEKTDPAEIALVRKLDFRIRPILWALYFLNYPDRNALPQARLNNLEKDLNLKGVEYNTAISNLFVGYLLTQGK